MSAVTRSALPPQAANTTPGTSRLPGDRPPMKSSTLGIIPADIIPVHSPTECPAIASGAMPSERSTSSSRRPIATTSAPCFSRSVASDPSNSGSNRSKCAATSEIRGSNCASTPGNRNATPPPRVIRPSGLNHSPSRPERGLPASTTSRAFARRCWVGLTSASRQGPEPTPDAPASSARASPVGVPAASSSSSSGPSETGRLRRLDAAGACMTTWPLIPPKPNAFTAATRGAPFAFQTSASVTSRNRVSSIFGFGSSACRVGGRTPWCSASAALMSPAAPAAGIAWPMFDLTEPRPARAPSADPKNFASVSSSAPSPTGVPVPWASIRPTDAGSMPASAQARFRARSWPSTAGVMRLASRPSLAIPVPEITA